MAMKTMTFDIPEYDKALDRYNRMTDEEKAFVDRLLAHPGEQLNEEVPLGFIEMLGCIVIANALNGRSEKAASVTEA